MRERHKLSFVLSSYFHPKFGSFERGKVGNSKASEAREWTPTLNRRLNEDRRDSIRLLKVFMRESHNATGLGAGLRSLSI